MGSTVDYHLSLGETENARIFFTVHVDPGVQIPEVPYEELEADVERLARTWDDDLLRRAHRAGRPRSRRGARREVGALASPTYYKASHRLEPHRRRRAGAGRARSRDPRASWSGLGNESSGERLTRVKLYKTGGKVDLSAFMPILEALGLRAVEEIPTAILGEGKIYIHDFGVLDARGAVLELDTLVGARGGHDQRGVAGRGRIRFAEPAGDLRGAHVA